MYSDCPKQALDTRQHSPTSAGHKAAIVTVITSPAESLRLTPLLSFKKFHLRWVIIQDFSNNAVWLWPDDISIALWLASSSPPKDAFC